MRHEPDSFLIAAIRYRRSMTVATDPFDDLIITFAPDATPEEEEHFLTELAHAIITVARHIVATQQAQADEDEQTIEF